MNPYVLALRRFWWLVLFGFSVGLLVAILLVYRVERFYPPKLVIRVPPTYTVTDQLLVTTPSSPFIRIADSTKRAAKPSGGQADALSSSQVGPLVDAANLFPAIIESEPVTALRTRMFGRQIGAIQANALFATRTAAKFHPSPLPIVEVTASSTTPRGALMLARTTVRAFQRWLVLNQTSSRVPTSLRISVQELRAPSGATKLRHTSKGLALFVALAVLAAFAALAVILDKLFPRRRAAITRVPTASHAEPLAARVHTGEAVVQTADGSSVTIADLAALLTSLVEADHRSGDTTDDKQETAPASRDPLDPGVAVLPRPVDSEAEHRAREEPILRARVEPQLGSE